MISKTLDVSISILLNSATNENILSSGYSLTSFSKILVSSGDFLVLMYDLMIYLAYFSSSDC